MTEPQEIELKFDADPESTEELQIRLSKSIGAPREQARRLIATYFDTRKSVLRRQGLSLRIRSDGGRRIQTLKASQCHNTFARSEWEIETRKDRPDPDLFQHKLPRKTLNASGTLRPVFVTDMRRTVWDVQHGHSQIEVSLDTGAVTANGPAARFAEVELELKTGAPVDLFGLARRLIVSTDLRLGVRSKAERGYSLAEGNSSVSTKAEAVCLTSDITAGEAFQMIARACLRHFHLNARLLFESRNANALHQSRVALRRLRSAMTLFKTVVADGRAEQMRAGLKQISAQLGEARNLDVYLARVETLAVSTENKVALEEYTARIEQARQAAHERVLASLREAGFRLFAVELAGWIEAGDWRTATKHPERNEAVARFAPRLLRKCQRAVRKKGRHLRRRSPEERHKLRIAAKKLRYAAEFFASLADGKKERVAHRAYIARLEALQENLGELNDIRTGKEMEHLLAGSGAADGRRVALTAGLVTGGLDAQEHDLLRAATKTFRRFAKTVSPLAS